VKTYLLMKIGERAGSRFELVEKEDNSLGRDWACRVVLDDPQCSRVHAIIETRDGEWWVRDCDSSNGTYVNGQRIRQARLVDGNELRVGVSAFTFCDQQAQAHSMPDGESPDRESPDGESPDGESDTPGKTVILDEAFDPGNTGQYTLDFLKHHNWGEDFFFLFQLSVKLLGKLDPDQVVDLCMERLQQRTRATVVGFLWLTDRGQLRPKTVFPKELAREVALEEKLTRRVVKRKQSIRIEHTTTHHGKEFADSICVPVCIVDDVIGAIHLYRRQESFKDGHFRLSNAVANIMARSLDRANRQAVLQADHDRLAAASGESSEMIGDSAPMRDLKSKIERVARASGCVLIRGESGSGKELVARALHQNSPRANRPMLSVNCAAIPPDLMESQLFGHKKGSFTSADRDHDGWFKQADTGTLFLDEIGELTLEGQAKLLRILEDHPFLPVGGTEEITVDVRVICATNRDLREFVREKKFREDLYYRLTVFELLIPPLRDRGRDIQRLVDHFLDHFRRKHGRPQLELSPKALEKLLTFQWPGNIRQLRNVIDSAVVMAEGERIDVDDLGIRHATGEELESLKIDFWERKLIRQALKRTDNHVPRAAGLLGISRATLYRKIDEYGIER